MRYDLISDAGHGWLEVPRKELFELGIENMISSYSYENDGFVYLEEDDDMNVFLQAKQKRGENVDIREHFEDPTVIRNYNYYGYTVRY